MKNHENYNLLIIGGGASGLAAAVTAVAAGVDNIAVLERLPRTGKKILATGNGRCNLSHDPVCAEDYAGSYDVSHVLAKFGSAAAFFENLGLYCRSDAQGRLYPYSMTASAVLDALRLHCRHTVELCGERAVKLYRDRKNSGWHVITEQQTHLTAQHVIFAAGGSVAPKFGTDGSAWHMLEELQIPLVESRPVLCPLRSDKTLLRELKGIRVKGAVSLCQNRKHHNKNEKKQGRQDLQVIHTETGEIQFTEQAVSGICVFNLVSWIEKAHFSDYTLSVNLFPELDKQELLARIYTCQAVRFATDCENLLSGLVRKPIAGLILRKQGIAPSMPCRMLTGLQIQRMTEALQDFRFPVFGTVDEQAQACAGGVHGDALDAYLQVKAHPGLYIVGEAVDVHAPCGGYQLHWAWASGSVAAGNLIPAMK